MVRLTAGVGPSAGSVGAAAGARAGALGRGLGFAFDFPLSWVGPRSVDDPAEEPDGSALRNKLGGIELPVPATAGTAREEADEVAVGAGPINGAVGWAAAKSPALDGGADVQY